MKTTLTSLSLVLIAFAAGCAGAEERTGTVELAAAAQPSDSEPTTEETPPLLDPHLTLDVKEVTVHVATPPDAEDDPADAGDAPDGDAGSEGGGADDDGAWVTVASGVRLDLRPGDNRISLGSTVVPAGELTQVRLVLDQNATLWTGIDAIQVPCPSCTTSGIKLVVDDHVEIPAGGTVDLTLMFDLESTALQTAAGSKLGPVIHAEIDAQP